MSSSSFRAFWDLKVGLRAGTRAENATYAMTDLDDLGYTDIQIARWVLDPDLEPDLTVLWGNRIQNSACMIAGLVGRTMNLLIVTKAGVSGERYSIAEAPCAVGAEQTFRKTNKLPPDSTTLAEKEFPATVDGVTEATAWVRTQLGRP